MPEFCDVERIDRNGHNDDPVVSTRLFYTSLGDVVAQTVSYRRGIPNTKYGLWSKTEIKTIPSPATSHVGAIPDPSDYTKPYEPIEPVSSATISESVPSREVYVVKVPVSEEDKRNLARVLRLEYQVNEAIDFFP